jgi:outer membrane PBP1 activator LpoA protein
MVMQMRTFIFLLLAMLWPFSSMADAKTTASQAEAELERAEHLQQQKQLLEALRLRVYVAPLLNDVRTYRKNHDEIWHLLKRLSPAEIRLAQTFREEADLQGWLDLLAQVQNGQVGVEQQVMALQHWLDSHTTHPAALIPVEEINTYRQATTKKITPYCCNSSV